MGPPVGAGAARPWPRSSALDFSPKVAVFALDVVEDAMAAQHANRKDADFNRGDFPIVSDDVTKEITSLTADNLSSRGHPWGAKLPGEGYPPRVDHTQWVVTSHVDTVPRPEWAHPTGESLGT